MTDPKVGERFAVTGPRGIEPNVYEFMGEEPAVDPVYRYALKLVSFEAWSTRLTLGAVMHVERAWFYVRGALPAAQEGAVRRVT